LALTGVTGSSLVNLNGNLTFAANNGLSVSSSTVDFHGATVNGNVTLGAGAVEVPDTNPTIFTVNGNYSLNSGATLRVQLNGSTVGTQYDQLAISGNITLGGALNVVCGPNLAPGSSFTIIHQTGTAATGTTFTGMAENSTFISSEGYTFRVNYNAGTGHDVVLSLVTTTLEQWRYANFNSLLNTGSGADTMNPSGDGVPNLLKYAMGMDPSKPGSVPQAVTRNASGMNFVFTLNKAASDVSLFVEWSDTLNGTDWSTAGVGAPLVLSDNGVTQQVQVTVPADAGVTGRFVRLEVTNP
jgi:hypothetical protein